MTHDAQDRHDAARDVIELLKTNGHAVKAYTVYEDGHLEVTLEPEGIGGGTTK